MTTYTIIDLDDGDIVEFEFDAEFAVDPFQQAAAAFSEEYFEIHNYQTHRSLALSTDGENWHSVFVETELVPSFWAKSAEMTEAEKRVFGRALADIRTDTDSETEELAIA